MLSLSRCPWHAVLGMLSLSYCGPNARCPWHAVLVILWAGLVCCCVGAAGRGDEASRAVRLPVHPFSLLPFPCFRALSPSAKYPGVHVPIAPC